MKYVKIKEDKNDKFTYVEIFIFELNVLRRKSEFDELIDYATKLRLGELVADYTWSRLGSVCSFVPPGKSEKLVWVVWKTPKER